MTRRRPHANSIWPTRRDLSGGYVKADGGLINCGSRGHREEDARVCALWPSSLRGSDARSCPERGTPRAGVLRVCLSPNLRQATKGSAVERVPRRDSAAMSDTRVPMAAMQDVRSLVVMLIDSEIANATDPTWEAIERHGHDVVVEAFNRIRQQVGGPCVQ